MDGNDLTFTAMANRVRSIPSLSREEELALFLEWRETQSEKAFNRLFESHLKLVLKEASARSRKSGFPASDLFQEGSIGLMRAIEKFDPQSGNRLGTYALHWIQSKMRTYVERHRYSIDIGKKSVRRNILRHLLEFKRKIGQFSWLTDEEVALFAMTHRLSLEDVQNLDLLTLDSIYSLDETIPGSSAPEGITLKDTIVDEKPTPEEYIVEGEAERKRSALFQEAIEFALPNERERYIFENRTLKEEDDEERQTLEELGQRFNLSRERVRQIETKSRVKVMARVRQIMVKKGITRDSVLSGLGKD